MGAVQDMAGRGARTRQSPRPDLRLDDCVLPQGEGIYTELDRLNTYHYEVDAKLRRLRSDVNLSGSSCAITCSTSSASAHPSIAQQLTAFRETTIATLAELHALLKGDQDRIVTPPGPARRLLGDVRPALRLDPVREILRSATFLRREVVPRREAVLAIAQEIEELNNANLVAQRAEVARRQTALHDDLYRLLLRTVLLGLAVALLAVFRSARAGAASDEQRANAQAAEHRCVSCRSSWSRRRRKSAATCRASCTTMSPRC